MELFTEKLLFIALFIFIIHSIETLAYAVRLSGARVKMIASALSLFNIMVIVSRLANMMQQPFTGTTFIALFSRAIIHLSRERGSVPSLMKRIFSLEYKVV
ncbi:lipid II flippase family protein [Sediminibacillus dalangtanensis]|uniref:lipid II flippase family protein n=1 Tax=Sediminibacillus dalangtanensis TaxID=2729421 RepID=UPI0035A94C84